MPKKWWFGKWTCLSFQTFRVSIPWAPKTMKNEGFGHLKTRILTIKTFRNVGLGGPYFQPLWKISVKLRIFPNFRGEQKRTLKPPPNIYLPSLKLTARTWKWMVGIQLFPFWEGNLSGAFAVSFREASYFLPTLAFSNGKHMVNVGKYTIHGCYGVYI